MPVSKKRKKSTPSQSSQVKPASPPRAGIHRSTITTMIGVAVALSVVGWLIFDGGQEDVTIKVIVPQFTAKAVKGEEIFNQNCFKCHGKHAAGSKEGPPLVDPFYRPSHHPDGSFVNAVQLGVRQHHWKFGRMPPQPKVRLAEIPYLISYVREIQRANGVF